MNKIFYKKEYIMLIILMACFPLAAHAYAGPGAAIGAIIVFLTVIIAFFASTFIRLFCYKTFFKQTNKQKKIRKKNNNIL